MPKPADKDRMDKHEAVEELERIRLENEMVGVLKTTARYLEGKPVDRDALHRNIVSVLHVLKSKGWEGA